MKKLKWISPVDSIEAAKISLMSHVFGKTLYVNFWHHLLDYDFSDISNGSIATMWDIEEKHIDDIKKQVLSLIRKIFFKEVTSIHVFQNGVKEI